MKYRGGVQEKKECLMGSLPKVVSIKTAYVLEGKEILIDRKEIAQQLRLYTVLPEDSSSVPSTNVGSIKAAYHSPSRMDTRRYTHTQLYRYKTQQV